MDIRGVYEQFVTQDVLEHIRREQGRDYHSVDEFILYRTRDLTNPYFLTWAAEELSEDEVKLLEQLKTVQSGEAFYIIPLHNGQYPFLIENYLIIDTMDGQGVIPEETVRALLNERKGSEDGRNWDKDISPVTRTILMSYADMTLLDLLGVIRISQLKRISKALTFIPDTLRKDEYVKGISGYLKDNEIITDVLIGLPNEDYQLIKEKAEEDVPFHLEGDLTETLIDSGLIIMIDDKYYITPYEILETIRRVNLTDVEAARRSRRRKSNQGDLDAGYNTLKLKVSIIGATDPIYREFIIPTRLNFYELHLIIQMIFGWQQQAAAKFIDKDGTLDIRVYEQDDEGAGQSSKLLNASVTQVDGLLISYGEMNYIYNYEFEWEQRIELVEYLTVEGTVIPQIMDYGGACPIEAAKGIGEFEAIYQIIKDKNHPGHEETLAWARANNYKGRYPKSAINRKLQKVFDKGYAVTEMNDPGSKNKPLAHRP